MLDKKLYIEIPGGNNNFHSAVLTSFAFNVHHFEYQVLKTLKRKWVSSINVLVDQRMLDDVFGVVSGNVKSLSRYYSLSGFKSKGAFHPKINFLVGDTKLLLLFGSGNLTVGGHGKNHELFTGFYADSLDSPQLPLLQEAWQYLVNLSIQLDGFVKTRISKVVPNACSLLNNEPISKHQFARFDEDIEVALVYNDETSIFDQLVTLIPKDQITKITIVCPYYDAEGTSLLNLKQHFKGAKIEAYVQKDFGLPPTEIKMLDNISFFDWDETDRGSKKLSNQVEFKRKLHSKIFHFNADGFEYCMIGSANATLQGLGEPGKNAINQEFGCLYKLKGNRILKNLGVTGPKIAVSITDYPREISLEEFNKAEPKQTKTVFIKAADLMHSKMIVYLESNTLEINGSLLIFNQMGLVLQEVKIANLREKKIITELPIEVKNSNPGYVQIEDVNGNPISGKQAINWLVDLENTDPTKSNRLLNQILGNIENQTFNEFEIIEFINNIQYHRNVNNNSKQDIIAFKGSKIEKIENINLVELTYEEAVQISKNKFVNNAYSGTHSSTRIWESVAALFKYKSTSIDDELMDEEEEGSAEISRDRNDQISLDSTITIRSSSDWARKYKSLKKLSENYLHTLKKINCQPERYELNVIDFHHFLLATHLLTHVGALTKFEFTSEINISNENKDLFFKEQLLEILTEFLKLCFKGKLNEHLDDISILEKLNNAVDHSIAYAVSILYLLDRKISEKIVKDKIQIIGLNIFKYLRKPNSKSDDFIKMFANNYSSEVFNSESVIRFKDTMLDIFDSNTKHKDLFFMKHSGICKTIETKGKDLQYISLFNINRINSNDKNIMYEW